MQDMTNEPGTGEQDVSQLATTVLAARLPAASPWMPRREMEELLRRGPDAAPPLIDVLRRAQGRGACAEVDAARVRVGDRGARPRPGRARPRRAGLAAALPAAARARLELPAHLARRRRPGPPIRPARARPRRARPRLAHALRRDHRHRRPPRGPPLPALRQRVLASGRAPRLPAHPAGPGRAPSPAARPR